MRSFAISGHDFAIIVERHVFTNFHLCLTSSLTTSIIIIEVGRKREIHILILMEILEFWQPVAVTSLVMHKECEGLIGITLLI